MEEYTFFDFDSNIHTRIGEHKIAVNHKKNNHNVTFNVWDSSDILQSGFKKVRLAKINLTGEILIVFNNEKGFNYFTSGKDGENKNIIIGKAGVSKFIVENLMDKEDFGRYIFKISKNIANSDEYMTYKIIGSE